MTEKSDRKKKSLQSIVHQIQQQITNNHLDKKFYQQLKSRQLHSHSQYKYSQNQYAKFLKIQQQQKLNTYSPIINQYSKRINNSESVYQRLYKKGEQQSKKKLERQLKDCSFFPEINYYFLKDYIPIHLRNPKFILQQQQAPKQTISKSKSIQISDRLHKEYLVKENKLKMASNQYFKQFQIELMNQTSKKIMNTSSNMYQRQQQFLFKKQQNKKNNSSHQYSFIPKINSDISNLSIQNRFDYLYEDAQKRRQRKDKLKQLYQQQFDFKPKLNKKQSIDQKFQQKQVKNHTTEIQEYPYSPDFKTKIQQKCQIQSLINKKNLIYKNKLLQELNQIQQEQKNEQQQQQMMRNKKKKKKEKIYRESSLWNIKGLDKFLSMKKKAYEKKNDMLSRPNRSFILL